MKKVIKKQTHKGKYGFNHQADFTPYYLGSKFIINLVTNTGDTFRNDEHQRNEVAINLRNLRKNSYKFLKFYAGRFKTPFDLISWVAKKGYTFERHGEFFHECDGFVDFHGNLSEYSNAFMFRIYDKSVLRQVKKAFSSMPQHIHY
jgi:hypothetical protein